MLLGDGDDIMMPINTSTSIQARVLLRDVRLELGHYAFDFEFIVHRRLGRSLLASGRIGLAEEC